MKTVKDIIDRKGATFLSVTPEVPIVEVARMMAEYGIGSLLVMRGDTLLGLVTERDVAYKLVCVGKSPLETSAGDIMSAHILCVTPENTVEECMALMTEKRVRHLPVLVDGRISGIVSIGDAVKAYIAEQQFIIEQLENYISS